MIESNYINREQSVFAKQWGRTNVLTALALMVATVVLVGHTTSAVTSTNNAPNTLKISPVRTDLEIKPGETKTVEMTVTNLTARPITVKPVQNDFVAGDERGTPALILDATKFAPTHSLKRFMQPLGDVTVPANQARQVKLSIAVPANAQAGGYFGAIRFAPTSPESGGQVNLSASAASLILMTVPGDAVEALELTNFDIQQNGRTGSNFRTPENLQASVRFKNNGNLQLGPIGKVSVTKGDDVVYEADFNNKDPRDMVLPDSARRWDIPLSNIGSFGQYKVSATFTYGKKNQTIEVTKSFWVVPTALIIAAIISLIVLIGLIVGVWLFLRSYKRRILRNSSRGGGYRRYR